MVIHQLRLCIMTNWVCVYNFRVTHDHLSGHFKWCKTVISSPDFRSLRNFSQYGKDFFLGVSKLNIL